MNILRTRNNTILFYCLFAAFVLWQLPGILPPVSYESDAVSISMGIEDASRTGWHNLGKTGYGYWMQPLTYILLAAVKAILPHVQAQAIYSILSSLAAIALQWVCILLVVRINGLSRFYALAALALLPEFYALAMYPNSTAIAALPVFVGFLLLTSRHLTSRRLVPAALLLTLAPLLRLDVIIIYPLAIVLLRHSGMGIKKTAALSAAYALFLILFLIAFYHVAGGSITHTLHEFSRFSNIISVKKNLQAIYGFYGPISLLTIPAAVIILLRRRQQYPVLLFAAAFFLVHGIELRFGNASKHFALLLPFAAAVSAVALRSVVLSGKVIKTLAAAITALYLFAGIRIARPAGLFSQPLLNPDAPTLLSTDFRLAHRHCVAVIGGGQPAVTSDEILLASGSFFYPWFVHNVKTSLAPRLTALVRACRAEPRGKFILVGWNESSRAYHLASIGLLDPSRLFPDKAIESIIEENPDSPGARQRIAEIVRHTYRPSTQNPVFLVFTESISHRLRFAIKLLCKDGLLEDTVYGDNIFRFPARR